jgi:hypothetical protein
MSLHLGVKFAPRRELAPPAGEKRSPLSSPIGAHTLLFRRMEGKYRFYLHPWGPTWGQSSPLGANFTPEGRVKYLPAYVPSCNCYLYM